MTKTVPETQNILNMRGSIKDIKNTEYFLDLATQYYDPEWIQRQKPKVIVLSAALSPEIIYAYTGENPFWVFGGSRAMTDISDSDVPRDTDPVSRSMLGYLQNAKHMAEDALVIVPLFSDNQRKLAFLLKDQGWNVETVHMPPYISIGCAVYEDEMRRLSGVLSLHLKKRFPSHKKAAAIKDEVSRAIQNFVLLSSKRSDAIPATLRMLVLGSFFMTQDVTTWLTQLEKLSKELSLYGAIPADELSAGKSPSGDRPSVLIVGSPIYFPGYKIPFLLEGIGLDFHCAASPLDFDSAGAHIKNDSLQSAMKEQIETLQPDGILWHILRGQNEYDFELLRLEEYITGQFNIPVFRLETDYQEQDVEQLRVRMEAFAELLSHQKTPEVRGSRVKLGMTVD